MIYSTNGVLTRFSYFALQSLTTAYVPHMDYLPRHLSSEFNYDSHKKGGNRYATVLLYMSDIPERGGGETGKFSIRLIALPSTNFVCVDVSSTPLNTCAHSVLLFSI